MKEWIFEHFSASASHRDMQAVVQGHGEIEVKEMGIGKMTVLAQPETVQAFQKKHPGWIINPVL